MKHVVKKSMMVAGVLACLFASTAFAQTVTTTSEQDKATQAAAPPAVGSSRLATPFLRLWRERKGAGLACV